MDRKLCIRVTVSVQSQAGGPGLERMATLDHRDSLLSYAWSIGSNGKKWKSQWSDACPHAAQAPVGNEAPHDLTPRKESSCTAWELRLLPAWSHDPRRLSACYRWPPSAAHRHRLVGTREFCLISSIKWGLAKDWERPTKRAIMTIIMYSDKTSLKET
jgi:hypothetical protein